MKLVKRIDPCQPINQAARPQTRRQMVLPQILGILAVAASVFLSGSTAHASDDEDLADCLSSCHIQYLRDTLACGRTAQACLEGFSSVYYPWLISRIERRICLTNQRTCELQAGTAKAECETSCYEESTERTREQTRRIQEETLFKLRGW